MKQVRAFGVGVLVTEPRGYAGLVYGTSWFLMRDVHTRVGTILLQPRWAMSLLCGPMTRNEIRQALEMRRNAFPMPVLPVLPVNGVEPVAVS